MKHSENQTVEKYALTIIAVLAMTTLQASIDQDSLLGKPGYFWWPGSMDNFIGCVESDATGATPPYHRRKIERWKNGWKVVFERADRVVVFLVTPASKSGCELVFVQTEAYRPADYEALERWEKNPNPNTPALPTIP